MLKNILGYFWRKSVPPTKKKFQINLLFLTKNFQKLLFQLFITSTFLAVASSNSGRRKCNIFPHLQKDFFLEINLNIL